MPSADLIIQARAPRDCGFAARQAIGHRRPNQEDEAAKALLGAFYTAKYVI
jgi:hypothetical protein